MESNEETISSKPSCSIFQFPEEEEEFDYEPFSPEEANSDENSSGEESSDDGNNEALEVHLVRDNLEKRWKRLDGTSVSTYQPHLQEKGPLTKRYDLRKILRFASVARRRLRARDGIFRNKRPPIKPNIAIKLKYLGDNSRKRHITATRKAWNKEGDKTRKLLNKVFVTENDFHLLPPININFERLRDSSTSFDSNKFVHCTRTVIEAGTVEEDITDLKITIVLSSHVEMYQNLFSDMCVSNLLSNNCNDKTCDKKHLFNNNFVERLVKLPNEELVVVYEFFKNKVIYHDVYRMFINAFAKIDRDFLAKNMVQHFLHHSRINSYESIRRVVLSLVSTGLQFHEAVNHVISLNKSILDNIKFSDILLKILAVHPDLDQNWYLAHSLLQNRTSLPYEIATYFISVCVAQPKPNLTMSKNIIEEIIDRNLIAMGDIPRFLFERLVWNASS